MVEFAFSIRSVLSLCGSKAAPKTNKKTDVAGHPEVSNHVGLLVNEPPGEPGCSLFSHPTTSTQLFTGSVFSLVSAPLTVLQRTPRYARDIPIKFRECLNAGAIALH
jgi:hypothetical protein